MKFAKFLRTPTFEEHLPKMACMYEIGSCSMLVSDVIFCIILQWTKKELMFEGHDPEVRSFWRSLLIN